jgi:predicted transposase YbfD/YdcC
LPVNGSEHVKQTNEITMAIPLLDALDIRGKDITGDALLTQRKLAHYLVEDRQAHYHFTAKGNQPTLQQDIADFFQDRKEPDFVEHTPPDHGRIETRKIWTTSALNTYLDFPHVGQAFVIERECLYKKSGKRSLDIVYGITRRTPEEAAAQRLLQINRGHWIASPFFAKPEMGPSDFRSKKLATTVAFGGPRSSCVRPVSVLRSATHSDRGSHQ